MSKKDIKDSITSERGKICKLSGDRLPDDTSLFDVHRLVHRAEGGTYTDENTIVTTPVAHMKEHGIYRERSPWYEKLKEIMDARSQTMNLQQKINNQFLAIQRGTDTMDPATEAMLNAALVPVAERLNQIDKDLVKHLKVSDDPLAKIVMAVGGVGPVTAASLLTYIDLEKADSPSSLWAYCGYDKASHERYTKGTAGGGNKTLRTVLYNWAVSMEKNVNQPYRPIYEATKARLSVSDKITKSRNTKGQLIECAWKDAKPCHRRGSAMRVAIKHFLADYWMIGRIASGLPTRTLYVEQHMGHDGIIKPADRGWDMAAAEAAGKKNSLL